MEFSEKLQELRKSKGMTQEELAQSLFVSRTAISKWESGRGYPSIDSLKEISKFFSVTIDDLLSGEKLLSIAEKENKSNIRRICDIFSGAADVCSFMLILLPLYPDPVNGYIYSVNLLGYTDTSAVMYMIHWILFIALILSGVARIILTKTGFEKSRGVMSVLSIILGIITVFFLALTREAYATATAFMLLVIKGILLYSGINHIQR